MAGVEENSTSHPESPEDDDLDPRIKDELDVLNSTSEEINKLEIELDSARSKFRSLLTDATQRLNLLFKKLGRCVSKARPYYELAKESKKAQAEAQRAVVKFHRANGIYRAAKETVALAEERLMSAGDNGEKREFDSAWQEMLNHATIKFMDSEKDKTLSEQEHLQRASEVTEIQKKLKAIEKTMPRTIPRSRPYFDLKERLEYQLQQEKLNVEDLVRALHSAKLRYRGALSTLEAISEEVHMKRKMAEVLPPRTPGVGAENLDSDVGSDLPSINLDLNSETSGDVMSINSDDYDVISTDGSEAGDMSPRPEHRSISLPVSPLARENSSSSLGGGPKLLHSSGGPLSDTREPLRKDYEIRGTTVGSSHHEREGGCGDHSQKEESKKVPVTNSQINYEKSEGPSQSEESLENGHGLPNGLPETEDQNEKTQNEVSILPKTQRFSSQENNNVSDFLNEKEEK